MTEDQERSASMREALATYNPKAGPCDHPEHDHGICLECGADITDELISRAEYRADCAQDR